MQEVKNDLLTNKCTRIYCEDKKNQKFNAPHHFKVYACDRFVQIDPSFPEVGCVDFQEGPVKENGVNGVANEDLLIMVLTRLESFQQSDWRCRENALAITKIEEALLWLRKRTIGRENRGVEGTSNK
ncbi:hypothetical protein [Pectinatus frisingensis]|uniref:hypothetical protein n=1 Tax=Pectinatus frisingensis TaxID=865 RepID=UPI003D80774E